MLNRCHKNPWKGLVAGVAGGLAASWVMNQFQAIWREQASGRKRAGGAQSQKQSTPHTGVARALQRRGLDETDDDATTRTAKAVATLGFGHRLSKREKKLGGAVAHYAMGATSGGLYGAAAEAWPVTTVGAGLPFGAAVWLVADDLVVPALGLSKKPTEFPLSTHVYALSSHLVYGLTTELGRRVVRRALR
jgi:hypothetical protein